MKTRPPGANRVRLCREALPVLLLLCAAAGVGCQEQAFADERIAQRTRSMERTWEVLAAREEDAPRRLRESWRVLDEENQRHAKNFEENVRLLDRLLKEDIERFLGRREEYEAIARWLLGGKPERLERTAIDLLY